MQFETRIELVGGDGATQYYNAEYGPMDISLQTLKAHTKGFNDCTAIISIRIQGSTWREVAAFHVA